MLRNDHGLVFKVFLGYIYLQHDLSLNIEIAIFANIIQSKYFYHRVMSLHTGTYVAYMVAIFERVEILNIKVQEINSFGRTILEFMYCMSP